MPGLPAAAAGHNVVAVDVHIVLVPSISGVLPVPLPHAFAGQLDTGLASTVTVAGRPAAVVGSGATCLPPHLPTPPGVGFARPPTNRATVAMGSGTVMIGGSPAARTGDTAITCNDPVDLPAGSIVAGGTVMIG